MKNKPLFWIAPAVLSLALAAGCSNTPQQPNPSIADSAPGSQTGITEPETVKEQNSPQQTYNNQPDTSPAIITPPDESAKTLGTGEAAERGNTVKTESDKSWNTKSPKLLGIALGDSQKPLPRCLARQ